NFLSGATVTVGGVAATNVIVVGATSITATTPAHAAGAVNIVVTTPGGSGTLTNGFTYLATPTVTNSNPASGPTAGGTSVTISGTGFVSGASVTFDGFAATNVVVVNSTTITATAPSDTSGPADIVLTNPDTQNDTLPAGFTYVAPPNVTDASPVSGT